MVEYGHGCVYRGSFTTHPSHRDIARSQDSRGNPNIRLPVANSCLPTTSAQFKLELTPICPAAVTRAMLFLVVYNRPLNDLPFFAEFLFVIETLVVGLGFRNVGIVCFHQKSVE